jgi:hypothetical protein
MPHLTEKTVFYSVPKTGSTWVRSALAGKRIGSRQYHLGARRHFYLNGLHGTPQTVSEELRSGRFEFCFVRRPEEWLRSLWASQMLAIHPPLRHHTEPEPDDPPLDVFPPRDLMCDSFELFVDLLIRRAPGYVTRVFQKYVGPNGDALDFVGHQERLREDFVRALSLAGEPIPPLPEGRANKSDPHLLREARLSDETKKRLLETESWILKTFYGGVNEC